MLINISNINAVSIIEKYLEDTNKLDYYINNLNKNISEYIGSQHQFFINLVQKYFVYINEILNRINDHKLKSRNNYWKFSLVEDGLFFNNIFTIEDVMFIKKSKLLEIYDSYNLNDDFIIELVNARINTLFYSNFEEWKEYIEESGSFKIMDIFFDKTKYNFEVYKNVDYSFMDKYLVVFENIYTSIDKIVNTDVEFSPYYDKKICRIEIKDNNINIYEEETNDYLYINPFDKIKQRIISHYF